jgi:hypothetical protein
MNTNWKGNSQSLFADLILKDPKKHLDTINSFSKVAEQIEEKTYGDNFICNSLKKISRSKLNKGCEIPLQGKLQTSEERNQRPQKMERSPILMDQKNQHSKNGYTIKSNLHV